MGSRICPEEAGPALHAGRPSRAGRGVAYGYGEIAGA